MVVVDTVATVLESDPVALEPIANVIDPEALDQVATSWAASEDSTPASISFEYCNCTVTLENDGTLLVTHDGHVHPATW